LAIFAVDSPLLLLIDGNWHECSAQNDNATRLDFDVGDAWMMAEYPDKTPPTFAS
jgi:hypothetical protein